MTWMGFNGYVKQRHKIQNNLLGLDMFCRKREEVVDRLVVKWSQPANPGITILTVGSRRGWISFSRWLAKFWLFPPFQMHCWMLAFSAEEGTEPYNHHQMQEIYSVNEDSDPSHLLVSFLEAETSFWTGFTSDTRQQVDSLWLIAQTYCSPDISAPFFFSKLRKKTWDLFAAFKSDLVPALSFMPSQQLRWCSAPPFFLLLLRNLIVKLLEEEQLWEVEGWAQVAACLPYIAWFSPRMSCTHLFLTPLLDFPSALKTELATWWTKCL